MPIRMLYPRFYGNPIKMRKYFRLRKDYQVGDPLRYPVLLKTPYQAHINFGKTTGVPNTGLVLNSVFAVQQSANKVTTKNIWKENESIPMIRQYKAYTDLVVNRNFFNMAYLRNIGFPIIAKLRNSSRGRGLVYLRDEEAVIDFLSDSSKPKEDYFFEKFFTATSEYRVHCSKWLKDRRYEFVIQHEGESKRFITNKGCFLAVKKLMSSDAYHTAMQEDGYVTRNMTEHLQFSTRFSPPRGWETMLEQACTALELLGLDFGFIDVMYNSESGQYIFSESGSNPGMGRLQDDEDATNITALVYQQAFVPMIMNKAQSISQFRTQAPQTICAE